MQINLDTDKWLRWCKLHLRWLLPVGLFLLSWFAAKLSAHNIGGMQFWYGALSAMTFIGGLTLGAVTLSLIYEGKL